MPLAKNEKATTQMSLLNAAQEMNFIISNGFTFKELTRMCLHGYCADTISVD
jgi:hypothetical protein